MSPRGVGAACQAVADHLAADGRLQPSVWLERGGDLQCAARAGAAEDQPKDGARHDVALAPDEPLPLAPAL